MGKSVILTLFVENPQGFRLSRLSLHKENPAGQ
jgi:hypothetical protein